MPVVETESPFDCVFCRRIELNEYDFMDMQKSAVSFEPLNPVVPGHRLFVPVVHASSALTYPVLAGEALAAAARYMTATGLEDANLITSVGTNATQTVWHTHVHLIPRTENDGVVLPWTDQIR